MANTVTENSTLDLIMGETLHSKCKHAILKIGPQKSQPDTLQADPAWDDSLFLSDRCLSQPAGSLVLFSHGDI